MSSEADFVALTDGNEQSVSSECGKSRYAALTDDCRFSGVLTHVLSLLAVPIVRLILWRFLYVILSMGRDSGINLSICTLHR